MRALAPSDPLPDSQVQRRTMVDCQIRTFDVTDQRLIERFLTVPRESFVPSDVRALAYSDIGFAVPAVGSDDDARYLLPPLVLARLLQGGRIASSDRVLDVAPGLGYGTAVLAGLAATVVALEADDSRRDALAGHLARVGIAGVSCHAGPLAEGCPQDGPFDVIVVNGAIERVPDALFGQLAEGGRLLAIKRGADDPTGRASKAMCYEKQGDSVSGRFLFDATAPCLPTFQNARQFVF